jgi:predicted O-methyltransferase YrrM
MKEKEIEIILEIIKDKKPKKVLEWGSGYSTLFFSKWLDRDAKWISIEHDEKFFKKNYLLLRLKALKNVIIYYVPPNNYPWTDEDNDGSYQDLRDYIEFQRRSST